MHPPQPPRGPFPGPAPSGNPFGRPGVPGMSGHPMPAPTKAPSRGPGGPGMGYPGAPAPAPSVAMGGAAAVAEVTRGPSVKIQPKVHYYRRMRTGRLHRMVIRIEPEGNVAAASSVAAGNLTPVTIQPIVPGALVTPTMSDVPLRTGGEAVFYVLPMVTGKIPEARLELAIAGRHFTNALLPMRANRGLLTRLMLLLTLLVTLFLASVPLNTWEPYRGYHGEKAMQEFLRDRMRRLGVVVPQESAAKLQTRSLKVPENLIPELQAEEEFFVTSWQQPSPEAERVTPPPVPLEQRPLPTWGARDYVYLALYRIEPLPSKTYQLLSYLQQIPLGLLYVFGAMMVLTLACWFAQRPTRKRVPGALLEMKA